MDESMCAVCLESIGKINYCVTECNHTFHTSCLLQCKGLCPLCRAVMVKAEAEPEPEPEPNCNAAAVVEGYTYANEYYNMDEDTVDEERERRRAIAMSATENCLEMHRVYLQKLETATAYEEEDPDLIEYARFRASIGDTECIGRFRGRKIGRNRTVSREKDKDNLDCIIS